MCNFKHSREIELKKNVNTIKIISIIKLAARLPWHRKMFFFFSFQFRWLVAMHILELMIICIRQVKCLVELHIPIGQKCIFFSFQNVIKKSCRVDGFLIKNLVYAIWFNFQCPLFIVRTYQHWHGDAEKKNMTESFQSYRTIIV